MWVEEMLIKIFKRIGLSGVEKQKEHHFLSGIAVIYLSLIFKSKNGKSVLQISQRKSSCQT